MEEIIALVLENLKYIGIGAVLFLISYFSNMCFGIWYNIKICGEQFDWKKIWQSVVKILMFVIGTTLLSVGITLIPIFANSVGFIIPEEYQEVFKSLAIIAVFLTTSCKYLVDAYKKFKEILGYQQPTESER